MTCARSCHITDWAWSCLDLDWMCFEPFLLVYFQTSFKRAFSTPYWILLITPCIVSSRDWISFNDKARSNGLSRGELLVNFSCLTLRSPVSRFFRHFVPWLKGLSGHWRWHVDKLKNSNANSCDVPFINFGVFFLFFFFHKLKCFFFSFSFIYLSVFRKVSHDRSRVNETCLKKTFNMWWLKTRTRRTQIFLHGFFSENQK